jgi:hypothetical protein
MGDGRALGRRNREQCPNLVTSGGVRERDKSRGGPPISTNSRAGGGEG